jgi:hypothetical protein
MKRNSLGKSRQMVRKVGVLKAGAVDLGMACGELKY